MTLVLPPPPPYALRTNDASSVEHASTSYGARLSAAALVGAISARFPSETCALLGDDVRAAALGLHVSGPDDVEGGAALLETIKNVSRTLRNLAADVGDARALAAVAVRRRLRGGSGRALRGGEIVDTPGAIPLETI